MKELDINKELPAVHIPNLVLFHGGEITVNLNKRFNEEYYDKIKEENFYAIALTLKSNKQMLDYIKNLTAEISKNFKGTEPYVEYVNNIDNITSIIASLVPYVNLPLEEKQEFLEIRSLKKRSLRVLDLLIEHKESIEF